MKLINYLKYIDKYENYERNCTNSIEFFEMHERNICYLVRWKLNNSIGKKGNNLADNFLKNIYVAKHYENQKWIERNV